MWQNSAQGMTSQAGRQGSDIAWKTCAIKNDKETTWTFHKGVVSGEAFYRGSGLLALTG